VTCGKRRGRRIYLLINIGDRAPSAPLLKPSFLEGFVVVRAGSDFLDLWDIFDRISVYFNLLVEGDYYE